MSDTINPTNTLWAERWQLLLDEFNVDVRRWRGQLNVAGCRLEAIDIGVGQISAQVQDRDRGACRVVVRVTPFRDEQWARLLDALGERTFFVAQLLAGELPPEIEQIFAEVGVHLVPTSLGETANECTCSLNAPRGQASHNRPVAALYAALVEMIADDPWLLFRLRGRTQPQILQALRQRRTPPPASQRQRHQPARHAGRRGGRQRPRGALRLGRPAQWQRRGRSRWARRNAERSRFGARRERRSGFDAGGADR